MFQLSDKEEALAHQRKVSYMLARSYEDLEKRLQAQLKELDISHNGAESKPESDRFKCAADHSSCPCDNIPVVMDEREDKTRMAGSQNKGEG